ncbi:MAG TPA: AAA family ATPase, partial [Kofleriaceae bacterium]
MARGPIVGRDVELGQLDEALADARAGRGGVALLIGEPGIGKSRLVEEVARRANQDAVWGRAWEAGGAPPYWPWTQVLRAIGGAATSVHVARVRGDAVDLPPAAADDRFLLFDAVTQHLIAAARPLVIIFEDLHAADEPSLHLLAFVATQLSTSPILIVGTYRDVEARLTASAGAILDRIARGARVIQPRRLGADDVMALVAAEPGLSIGSDAVAALHRRSEGNPLFVVELLRVIARQGAQGAVPASVRTAIREHLRGLPADVAAVLDAAAAIGREFTTSVLADVCKRSPNEVHDALDAAVELGVLVVRGPSRYAFAHGLIQETRHDDLPAGRRAELHLAVANALERDPARPLTEIAHHLLDAGPDHADRAAEVAQQAAERSRRQLAFEPAAALIERVLATSPPSSQTARFELLRLLAEVRILAGDDARGKEAAREAAELARTLGSAELLARAALTYGLAYNVGSTDQVLVQLLEEALAALPPGDLALRAHMLARLAAALTPSRDMNPPLAIAREAIAMAQRLGDPRTQLEVIYAAMSALSLFAPPAERVALTQQTLALAERFDEPLIALRAHHRLILDFFQLADLTRVE